MIHVIVAGDIEIRTKHRKAIFKEYPGEIIFIDDSSASLNSLEHYAYPSLFSFQAPVVHSKYLIEEYSDVLTKEIIKTLVSSPTIFIFEEKSIASPIVKLLEKEGAIIVQDKTLKKEIKGKTIFAVTEALTLSSKKNRWLVYRQSRAEHSAEAIIGILYWKLRDLIGKTRGDNTNLKKLYQSLINAHKKSWQKGFPLELAIEKVILEK